MPSALRLSGHVVDQRIAFVLHQHTIAVAIHLINGSSAHRIIPFGHYLVECLPDKAFNLGQLSQPTNVDAHDRVCVQDTGCGIGLVNNEHLKIKINTFFTSSQCKKGSMRNKKH